VGLGIVRRKRDRRAIALSRTFVLALHLANKSEIEMNARDFRSGREGALEACRCFGSTTLGEVAEPEIIVRAEVAGTAADRLLARADRFGRVAGGAQLRRDLVPGFHRIGIELERALEQPDGNRGPPRFSRDHALQHDRGRKTRHRGKKALAECLGQLQVPIAKSKPRLRQQTVLRCQ
jgi:hypothetical protein